MAFTSVRALALAGMMACSWSGCGHANRDAAGGAAGASSSAGAANAGAGGAAGSSASAGAAGTAGSSISGGASGAGTMMLEGYERLTGAALDYARNVCRCLGGLEGEALEGCAFADAHEYSGLRIDSPDSKRCFEQELVPAFSEIVECETRRLESIRDCTDSLLPGCSDLSQCVSRFTCSALPNHGAYRAQADHCARVLYCDSGEEAEGWRCNERPDCLDESDEAGCQ